MEQEYDIQQSLKPVILSIREMCKVKGLYFGVSIDRQIPGRLYGDGTKLAKVLSKLLEDAVYRTEEGEILLKAVLISSNDNKCRLYFGIKDSGKHMPSPNTDAVRHYLETVGAELKTEEQAEKGSVFYFSIDQIIITDKKESASEEVLPELEALKKVDGLSLSDGLNFCGSKKALLKFLNTFLNTIDDKAYEIEDALKRNDIEFFTIKVHALKSTSRIIGATKLSELAKALEGAGKSGDVDFIRAKTDKLLEMYRNYKNTLSVLNKKEKSVETNKQMVPADMLDDAYEALKELIPAMDYDSIEMIIGELKKYRLPKEDKERFNKLEQLLLNMDWEGMSQVIEDYQ